MQCLECTSGRATVNEKKKSWTGRGDQIENSPCFPLSTVSSTAAAVTAVIFTVNADIVGARYCKALVYPDVLARAERQ